MARKEITRYFDDLDGTPLDEDEVNVVRFGYKGRQYMLDLSEENAGKFDEMMAGYVEKASPVEPVQQRVRRTTRSTNANRNRNRIIREWARQQGIQVADRGALSKDVIAKYEAAHA